MNEGKIGHHNEFSHEEQFRHTIVTIYGKTIDGIITHQDANDTIIKLESGGYYNLPSNAVREIRQIT